jgi:hypothetical protein
MDLRKLSQPSWEPPREPAQPKQPKPTKAAPPPKPPKKRRKWGGRKKGALNKATRIKIAEAEAASAAAKRGTLAVERMDEMIEFLRGVVAKLVPWQADGAAIEGRDVKTWLRIVESFERFLVARAPYQSARLSAVAIVPAAQRQRTVVNVTILNERGEKVWSDVPADDELKQIEGAVDGEDAEDILSDAGS